MQKILMAMTIALMVATASIATTSCSKDAGLNAPETAAMTEVYDLALRFRADEGITETAVYFYDSDLVQVAVDILDVPQSENEVRIISFLSDSKPVWIYTPGLQNVDDSTGMCPVAGRSVLTKADGQEATLLIIRRE